MEEGSFRDEESHFVWKLIMAKVAHLSLWILRPAIDVPGMVREMEPWCQVKPRKWRSLGVHKRASNLRGGRRSSHENTGHLIISALILEGLWKLCSHFGLIWFGLVCQGQGGLRIRTSYITMSLYVTHPCSFQTMLYGTLWMQRVL